MTGTVMHISHTKWGGQHVLPLDRATKDALADYCRTRWPHHTAKLAAREWDLTVDEARGVIAARASQATIDRIWKHPRGGWPVIIPVLARVVGHGVETFIQAERATHAELARGNGALLRNLHAGFSVGSCGPGDVGREQDRSRRAQPF